MINKQRVKRIKNVIQAFIVLLALLPIVLIIIMFINMFMFLNEANGVLKELKENAVISTEISAPESLEAAKTSFPGSDLHNLSEQGASLGDTDNIRDNPPKASEAPAEDKNNSDSLELPIEGDNSYKTVYQNGTASAVSPPSTGLN